MEKKKNKVLIMIRTSSSGQSIEDQHNEMLEFVKYEGYNEEDCVWIEEQGASAAKLDEIYRAQLKSIKDAIEEDNSINCFACWHLNRAFRTEEAYIDIKSFMVPRKIQMLVKNPSLRLLNPDGTINGGMELAFGLFSILNKQDNEERKAKFKRAKSSMAKKGMYVGGNNKRFGYRVDDNQFFVIDENDSAIVKKAFELYSTGEYSTARLAKELTDRGYKRSDGWPINQAFISRVILSECYTGKPMEAAHQRIYPPIISQDLFDKCREIAGENKIMTRRGEKEVLGSKIIKCAECGSTYTSNSRHFTCCRSRNPNATYACNNKLAIRQDIINEILWRVAYPEHLEYLMDISQERIEEYKNQLEVIDQKISALTQKIENVQGKKQRIIDTFLDGLIDKKTRDFRLSKVDGEVLTHNTQLISLNEAKNAICGLISGASSDLDEMELMNAMDAMDISEKSNDEKYNIIHQHILKVIPERIEFGNRRKDNLKTNKPNAVLFSIYLVRGPIKKFVFIPKTHGGKDNLFIWNGNKWVGEFFKVTKKGA